jgi:hypothetical protein
MVAVVTLRRTSNMAALMKNLVGWKLNTRIASRPLSDMQSDAGYQELALAQRGHDGGEARGAAGRNLDNIEITSLAGRTRDTTDVPHRQLGTPLA